MRLGSGNCEIKLQDPQVPDVHSQFLLDSNDSLVLVCNNAVYEILSNGQSLKKLPLTHLLTFQVGATKLQVKITKQPIAVTANESIENSQTMASTDSLSEKTQVSLLTKVPSEGTALGGKTTGAFPTKVLKTETFKEKLVTQLKFTAELQTKVDENQINFRLFKAPFQLRILEGPQADDIFVISWGPRDFGPSSTEFPFDYPPYPGILFSLTPNEHGEIFFSTQTPQFARVNNGSDAFCVLELGDRITAGESTLIVEEVKEL